MKTAKRIVSIMLVFILTASLCSAVFADDKKPYSYVAIGDSTCNGYESDEYVSYGMNDLNVGKNPGIYPNLMGQYLSGTLHRDVEVNCLLPNGIRAHELRAVLDPEFVGDKYCQNHINQWSDRYGNYDQLHKTFCEAIANADMLSIDVFMSSLGNYFSNRVKHVLGVLNDKDYDTFYANDLLSSYADQKYSSIVKIVESLRNDTVAALEAVGLPAKTIAGIVDAYEYSVGTLMINFTESVKLIYELNDDIQLIVMSPFVTTSYDLTIAFGGVSINLGSILHSYVNTVYNYIIHFDPNCNRYKLADMYHTFLHCYTDAISEGAWNQYAHVTKEIRNILIAHGVAVDPNDPVQDKYFTEIVRDNVGKALGDTQFNLTMAPYDLLRALIQDGSNTQDVVNSLIKTAAEDYDHAPAVAQLALRLLLVFEGWGCHPDYIGHQQKFEAIQEAFEHPYCANYTNLFRPQAVLASLQDTIKDGRSVLQFVKDLITTSRFGVFSPRLFIK